MYKENFGESIRREDTVILPAVTASNERQRISKHLLKIIGRYHLIEEVGSGAMGNVFKAKDLYLDRPPLALKVLKPDIANSRKIEYFRREAAILARLTHPNIVPFYDFGEIEEKCFFTMKFIDGISLDKMLQKDRSSLTKTCQIMMSILDGLEYAHKLGIIHRDLKPSNILFDNGIPIITDFGLSKVIQESSVISQPGTVMGTPAYMSPEQAKGELIDHRSDLFAMGTIFYELLTGKRAFLGDNGVAILYQVVHGEVKSPNHIFPEIPKSLTLVCMKAIAKKREERYQNAFEMKKAIQMCC